jgi:nucleotide-binding universal stress UspA family protein
VAAAPLVQAGAQQPTRGIDTIMFKKVIVGDDGRDGGADALALARALAPGAELIVAGAYPWDPSPSRFLQPGYGEILRNDTEAGLERRVAAALLSGRARTVALPDSSPARALHRLAEAEHADLIVTGSAHHGAAGRTLLGSVSRSVLHDAPAPVAVAPRGFAIRAIRTIGVAFDHSPEAERALAVALDLAAGLGASLRVREVVAADLLPAIAGYPIVYDDDVTAAIVADALDRLTARIGQLDTEVDITPEAVPGTTGERLVELAGGVDLLVSGSRGWGAVRRVILGSTADHLIHHADAPVLVVPRNAELA